MIYPVLGYCLEFNYHHVGAILLCVRRKDGLE
jgi:hypothetical protein